MPKVVLPPSRRLALHAGCGDRPNGRDANRTELTRDPFPHVGFKAMAADGEREDPSLPLSVARLQPAPQQEAAVLATV